VFTTIPVPFDHHSRNGGRIAFGEWVREAGDQACILHPVFRYGRAFSDALDDLRSLCHSQQHVFLCNIVGYSAVLTSRSDFDAGADLAFAYDDIEALIESPNITGCLVDQDSLFAAMAGLEGWQVVCGEHSFDEPPHEAGLWVWHTVPPQQPRSDAEGTLFCRLSDTKQFASNWAYTSFRAYFIPPSVALDPVVVADRFRRQRLTAFLLRRRISFGTMGDCHMDDDIAVSCLSSVFDFPDRLRCFIR
jgi:hypothetical protein